MKKVSLLTLLVLGVALLGTATAQIEKDPALVDQRTIPERVFVPSGQSPFCSTPGLPLDSNLPPAVDTMTLAEGLILSDLDVSLDITHTWIGDLTVELTSPTTGPIALQVTICGNVDDEMAIIDDAAGAVVCASPIVGSFSDQAGALANFNGEQLTGDWTITVTDPVGGDSGTLNEWCLLTVPLPVELQSFDVE